MRGSTGGGISGRVLNRVGEPVEGAVVLLGGDSPSHPDIAAVTDAAGVFGFDDLVPGEYTVVVNAESGPVATVTVSVRAGETAPADVTVSA